MSVTGQPPRPHAPRIETVPWDDPIARRLCAAQQRELSARYGPSDVTPDPASIPLDVMLVIWVADEPVGCGGVRALAPGIGEIKRMYIVPGHRGRGLARPLLTALENAAAAAPRHWQELRLETGLPQHEALGLYTSTGYRLIEPYGMYRHNPVTRCYAKTLSPATGGSAPDSTAAESNGSESTRADSSVGNNTAADSTGVKSSVGNNTAVDPAVASTPAHHRRD